MDMLVICPTIPIAPTKKSDADQTFWFAFAW